MSSFWQHLLASLKTAQKFWGVSSCSASLLSSFDITPRYNQSINKRPPAWVLWVDTSHWHLASLGKNDNHPFETADVRLASTIVQGLLTLPKHPEMPAVTVVSVNQQGYQLVGIFRSIHRFFPSSLVAQLQGLWWLRQAIPFQAKLSEQYQQAQVLNALLERSKHQLSWQKKLQHWLLKAVFVPFQWGFSFLQERLIQASCCPKTNEGWQGQGLCFGLIEFLNSPITAKEPHPPTVIYFTTEFDTQLLLDDELQPIIAEILPTMAQPNDVFLMPSYWHQRQFFAQFPQVPTPQVQVLYPCVDSLFRLNEGKRSAIKKLANALPFLATVGLPPETPFFLVVLDKAKSFRWFHTVLAGFECFHDIREADSIVADVERETVEPSANTPPVLPHVVVVGVGLADFPAYQKLLEEALPEALQNRVHLHGMVPPSLLLTLYCSAKGLFYIPAERELGLGLSVLEALVVQCPVVVSKVGHLEEWSEKASLLLEPHEPIQVAFAMAQLMDEVDLADALRHNGRKRSLLCRVEDFTQQLLGFFAGNALPSDTVEPAKTKKSAVQ